MSDSLFDTIEYPCPDDSTRMIHEAAWIQLLIPMLILPLVLFYDEVIFRILTGIRPGYSLLPVFFFSLIYGVIGYLISSISYSRRVNHGIKTALMAVAALPYLTEYFIFRMFKVFYSLDTITNAVDDVVTSKFRVDALKMIFSPRGLLVLLLYACIPVLYGIFGRRIDRCGGATKRKRLFALGLIAVGILANVCLIAIPRNYRQAYHSRYTFQTAVSNFGVMTGARLETIRAAGGGHDTIAFEKVRKKKDPPKEVYEDDRTKYGEHKLDIDYAQLAAKTDDKELKRMDAYVASQTPSSKNPYTGMFKDKNLILISAEAFTAEAIDEQRTPTLYRMANRGIRFTDYTQPASAGTTGGEVQNIFGVLPTQGGGSFKTLAKHHNYYTMSWQLNRLGYYGKAYHDNSYTYYGRDVTHQKLGYSDGFMGIGNGMEKYVKTDGWPESDLEMINGTVPEYIGKDHFSIYYMTVSGHNGYSWGENKMAAKNRETVADLEASGQYHEPVLAYLAANVELDRAMESLIRQLEEAGKAEDTVIVISADHFPYGLDEDASFGNQPNLAELYGYVPQNILERDHNRLIIWCGSLEKEEPIEVKDPVSSLDILPTLMNLFGIEFDSRLVLGRDVFSDASPLVWDIEYNWKTDQGTCINGNFTPAQGKDRASDDYIAAVNSIVNNKMAFNKGLLRKDYYLHIFGKQ